MDIYILTYFRFIKFELMKKIEHHIHESISKVFVPYFYYSKVLQNLYSTYHEFNEMHNGLIFKWK
jgi:hypothetical protein